MIDNLATQPKCLFIYFLIAVLAYFIFLSANRGIADVKSYTATVIMNSWANGKPVESQAWNEAHRALLSALAFSPDNPDYLASLGNLYEWRVAHKRLNAAGVIADYRKALDYYQQALAKRPAYAYYWANIAVVKSILGEVDKTFYLAVDRSLALGPWEPGVQLKIADATLRVWYLLDDHGWEKMRENIERGLESNAATIMEKAKQVQVINKLCGKLRRTETVRQFCK